MKWVLIIGGAAAVLLFLLTRKGGIAGALGAPTALPPPTGGSTYGPGASSQGVNLAKRDFCKRYKVTGPPCN